MEILFALGGLIVGLLIGLYVASSSCIHQWKVIGQYDICRTKDRAVTGYMSVKECELCHEIKKHEISINT